MPSAGWAWGVDRIMYRPLNLKFAGWLLGILVLAGVAFHAWHEFQVRRHAGAWLEQARMAQARGETRRSLTYLSHYLAYQPADDEARADYGMLLASVAASPAARGQAQAILEQVLARQPQRSDIRAQL